MAESVILSLTQQLHLICTTVTCVFVCMCVCLVSGIGILTVFHIREGETSECYCKRSTSCLISKNLSLFLSLTLRQIHTYACYTHKHTHTQKPWQAKFSFYFFPFSLFLSFWLRVPSLCVSLSFSNKHRFAAEGRKGSEDERGEKTSTQRERWQERD